ncbi:MAG: hypothetical protein ACJ71Q_18260 [Terriglobales bacterium]
MYSLYASAPAVRSEWQDRIELSHFLNDDAALNALTISYWPTYRQVVYVYGSGKLIAQSYPGLSFSKEYGVFPTCKAVLSPEKVRDVLRVMIQVHFFDLPQRSFVYAVASDDMEDFEKEWRRHSIALDDGTTHAQRDFADGTYMGKRESIPQKFAAVETTLQRLMKETFKDTPCKVDYYVRPPSPIERR